MAARRPAARPAAARRPWVQRPEDVTKMVLYDLGAYLAEAELPLRVTIEGAGQMEPLVLYYAADDAGRVRLVGDPGRPPPEVGYLGAGMVARS